MMMILFIGVIIFLFLLAGAVFWTPWNSGGSDGSSPGTGGGGGSSEGGGGSGSGGPSNGGGSSDGSWYREAPFDGGYVLVYDA